MTNHPDHTQLPAFRGAYTSFFFKITWAVVLSVALARSQTMPWAGGKIDAERLSVYLVTFGPGDDLTTWFGHTGLVVRDSVSRVSKIYNFGLFAFDEGFIKNFIFGRLIFWKGRSSLAPMLSYYKNEHRAIRFSELNPEPVQKRILAARLEDEVRPGNRQYLYDHYKDNCATRLRDMIDDALHGQFKEHNNQKEAFTYRDLTMQYTDAHPLWQWLLLFLMNNTIDRRLTRWEAMFLPDYLERYSNEMIYTDKNGNKMPLVSRRWTEYDAERAPVPPIDQLNRRPLWPLLWGVTYGILLFLLSRIARNGLVFRRFFALVLFLFPFFAGVIGSVLFFMAFFTDHTVTWHNENLLLWHPLTLLTSFFALGMLSREKHHTKWKQLEWLWLAQSLIVLLLLTAKIFPAFNQQNFMALSFGVPFVWAHYWALKQFNS